MPSNTDPGSCIPRWLPTASSIPIYSERSTTASEKHMISKLLAILLIFLSAAMVTSLRPAAASQTSYDTTTLAGKLASVNNTPGLLITLSGFLQQEADMSDQNTNPTPNAAIAT